MSSSRRTLPRSATRASSTRSRRPDKRLRMTARVASRTLIAPSCRLQARQVAGVTIAVQMNERFGGEHTDLTPAPLRHDLVVLPPDALAVLADVREQGGLFLFDH